MRATPLGPFGGLLVCVAVLVPASGCTSSSSEQGNGSASCARRITLEGRNYADVGGVEVTPGDKLGSVKFLSCDDTGGQGKQSGNEEVEETNAYEIEGLDSKVAVAIGNSVNDVDLFSLEKKGGGLPNEVQEFIDKSQP